MMKNKRFNKIFDKLAAEETTFLQSEFLCPVIRSKPVRVRLTGVVMTLDIARPKNFAGWGVFRPYDFKTAFFVREPKLQERQRYLNLFPVLRLIVCARTDDQYFGIPANAADTRFRVSGLIPINMPQEVMMFETVMTRFDGENCWYDRNDSSASMKNAAILRDALAQMTDIQNVTSSGMRKEEKQAYATAYVRELENRKDRNEERIKEALARAGAEYRSYVERGDTYTVEYVVDGENHRSVVNKENLSVQSAGICLSGGDRTFDLQSLVGVVKEGIRRRLINRVGLNSNYDNDRDYEYDDDY